MELITDADLDEAEEDIRCGWAVQVHRAQDLVPEVRRLRAELARERVALERLTAAYLLANGDRHE